MDAVGTRASYIRLFFCTLKFLSKNNLDYGLTRETTRARAVDESSLKLRLFALPTMASMLVLVGTKVRGLSTLDSLRGCALFLYPPALASSRSPPAVALDLGYRHALPAVCSVTLSTLHYIH
jgi:hypothetical protein